MSTSHRIISLLKCGIVCVALGQTGTVILAQEPEAIDYTLSMAGALINNWCGSRWQDSDYVSLHGCNYDLAQRYHLEVSSADFENCAVANGGDIVGIADCMLERFTSWIAEENSNAQ